MHGCDDERRRLLIVDDYRFIAGVIKHRSGDHRVRRVSRGKYWAKESDDLPTSVRDLILSENVMIC